MECGAYLPNFERRKSKYENNPQIQAIKSITSCLVIAGDQIVDYLKKGTNYLLSTETPQMVLYLWQTDS